MSLYKSIQAGKEHRQPYRRSARFDPSCRHGGGCDWCRGNRTFTNQRLSEREEDLLQEFEEPYFDQIEIDEFTED